MSAAPQGSRLHLRLFQKHRLTKSKICNRRITTTGFLLKWWYIKTNRILNPMTMIFIKVRTENVSFEIIQIITICITNNGLLESKDCIKWKSESFLIPLGTKYLLGKTNNLNIPQLMATYTDSDLNQTKHSIPKLRLKLNEIWIFYYTYQWSRS